MQSFWELIKNYYSEIGIKYNVNPVIFVGIHIVATPLFMFTVAWLIDWYHKKKEIIYPLIVSIFIFNAANIYLVLFGNHIPWIVYSILAFTTALTSYFSYLKIRKRINNNSGFNI